MKAPDISVVVTNHNYGKYIRRCLRSLINQDLERNRYEIIIVDDHSTDDSLEAVKTFQGAGDVKVIVNKRNLGVGASSRIGVDNVESISFGWMRTIMFSHRSSRCSTTF